MSESPSAERAWLRPGFLRRSITLLARAGVLGGLALLVFAWRLPLDPTTGPAHPRWELMAALIDTLRFQLGVALGVATLWLTLVRSWRFAVLALLLCAWAVLPALTWPASERQAVSGAASVRVMSINLGMNMADEDLVLEALRQIDPDVLVIQEYTPTWARRLVARFTEQLPHRVERPREDAFGIAAFSSQPWLRVDELELDGSPAPQLRLELALGETPVVLYAIHLLPPVAARYTAHRRQCADLLKRLASEGPHTLAAGDFNLVDHASIGRALHQLGYLDAHGLAGRSRGATWPERGWLRFLPGVRIDHVYLGNGLTSTAAWVAERTGSDHLPIACDVTLARK
ncbi:MAG: endonuclease/exonuclease/phosphatase family protein [Planctomycetota bacterium]